MKILNSTDWRTDHIKALAMACARRVFDPAQIKRITVEVTNRGRWCLGRGQMGHSSKYPARRIWLYMNQDHNHDPARLAAVIDHEFGHLRGLNHREMKAARMFDYHPDWRQNYQWAAAYPLEKKPAPAPKPRPTAADNLGARIDKAHSKAMEWERKIRLAQGHHRRWVRRMKDAMRRLEKLKKEEAAATPESPPPVSA